MWVNIKSTLDSLGFRNKAVSLGGLRLTTAFNHRKCDQVSNTDIEAGKDEYLLMIALCGFS